MMMTGYRKTTLPPVPAVPPVRWRLTVTGVVQGVGFRPFVYGLAQRHGLAGFVGNDSGGVFIEVEGSATAVNSFHHDLIHQPPPLAHIAHVTAEPLSPRGEREFVIVHSQAQAAANTLISPDICLCDDCLHELFDPANRRYRYPFINCTNCGPRFTIIREIPYDRPYTTMAEFPLCPACQAEYDDPLDRRFHAQPNACPACGPQVWLEVSGAIFKIAPQRGDAAVQQAQTLLAAGHIVAVKGLGGFHLACDVTNDAALATLRERKGRVDKPFAVMAGDVDVVRQFAHVSDEEAALLTSKERPILLLRQKENSPLSPLIAPGNNTIGVMLPYTPLHYLLLDTQPHVLVMTSANYSDEPIVKDNDEARERLAILADAFLMHNREIHGRCDDSVVRVIGNRLSDIGHPTTAYCSLLTANCSRTLRPSLTAHLLPLRRSRGYAPFPVKLPYSLPPTLAVGGELKSTFCLAKGEYGYMSQHIGDMENLETLQAFTTAVTHFRHIFRADPERLVCDLHPGYLSTRWAEEQAAQNGLPLVKVQHHHAHIASVMAEHQLDGRTPVIGFSFDGTGYGVDGAVWGGELLLADYAGFDRAAHLKYVPLAGGDVAVKRPYRLALAHLWAAGLAWDEALPCVAACSPAERWILRQQFEQGINSVPTSSMGRLFDAVAALVGIRQVVTYEGQAAMELETAVAAHVTEHYSFALAGSEIDPAPVIAAIVRDMKVGVDTAVIAARFHNTVADLIVRLSVQMRAEHGLKTVALSGGVFQNVAVLETAVQQLQQQDFTVLTHRLVPPNDGGLALGQVMVGAK